MKRHASKCQRLRQEWLLMSLTAQSCLAGGTGGAKWVMMDGWIDQVLSWPSIPGSCGALMCELRWHSKNVSAHIFKDSFGKISNLQKVMKDMKINV